MHYQDLWPEIKNKIKSMLNDQVHLYITVNHATNASCSQGAFMSSIAKKVFLLENKGADIGPFVYVWNQIKDLGYKYVLKIHGKKCIYLKNKDIGKNQRIKMMNPLVRYKAKFDQNIFFMEQNQSIYMAGAKKYYYNESIEPLKSKNRSECQDKITEILNYVNSCQHSCFFAGSMFLVRTDYLNKFFGNCDLEYLYHQFENYHEKNGLLAHAFERVIGYGVKHHGGQFLLLGQKVEKCELAP